jgi:hypothetical protein
MQYYFHPKREGRLLRYCNQLNSSEQHKTCDNSASRQVMKRLQEVIKETINHHIYKGGYDSAMSIKLDPLGKASRGIDRTPAAAYHVATLSGLKIARNSCIPTTTLHARSDY